MLIKTNQLLTALFPRFHRLLSFHHRCCPSQLTVAAVLRDMSELYEQINRMVTIVMSVVLAFLNKICNRHPHCFELQLSQFLPSNVSCDSAAEIIINKSPRFLLGVGGGSLKAHFPKSNNWIEILTSLRGHVMLCLVQSMCNQLR